MHADFAMQRAIELARCGLGKTRGNPIVGAVIFDSSGIISEGFHQSGPHAEVVAINNAKRDLSGTSIAVTLEPCNHQGKTPPCTDAIIAAGIKEVIYAVKDPHVIAAGGSETLAKAGIEVTSGVLDKEASFANRAWLFAIKHHRPYFTWKIAATLDGKIAAVDGTSKWITNEKSRAYVSQLRAESDAIIVGTGTALADDPNLVVDGVHHAPLRVIVGQREIPATAKAFDDRAPSYHHRSRNLHTLAATLWERNAVNALVEAGPELGTAMLKAGLINEIALFTAPKILGAGHNAINDLGISSITQALTLTPIDHRQFDGDLFTRYAVTR